MRLRSGERQTTAAEDLRTGALDRQRIGDMLNLDATTTAAIVAHQASTGRLFGEAAIELGIVTADQVQRAVEEQQGFSVLEAGDPRIDPLVVSAFDPDDSLAMSIRALRAMVTGAKRPDGTAVKSIAMLGLDSGAETAVLAANLAVAFAQTGYLTLLVDADLTNPQHHSLFRLGNRAGLTTLLSNASRAEAVAQQSAIKRLSVVTSGPAVPNASELLDRRRLAAGLEPMLDDYDLVLVDAGDASEGAVSAALGLDASILIIRRDVTETRVLSRLVDQMETGGLTILGTILVD
ncbi:hypothetical protein ACFOKI_11715 [Sphingomonas qilianensis]|uniref:Non-specific protein-tyrosine kinase n=1 Tax=Sphingomonas qilianensis TaxID=1736690 RepID=A0ABU9XP42_9SPHN